jgi:hypothetical protein
LRIFGSVAPTAALEINNETNAEDLICARDNSGGCVFLVADGGVATFASTATTQVVLDSASVAGAMEFKVSGVTKATLGRTGNSSYFSQTEAGDFAIRAEQNLWLGGQGDNATLVLGASRTAYVGNGTSNVSPANGIIRGTGSRAGIDTNVAGANFVRLSSLGTGNAVPSFLRDQTPALGTASGTGAQTAVDRVCIGVSKSLTNNTVTTVISNVDANNSALALNVHYGVEIFDGTNVQYESGMVSCGVNNKGGVFTQNTCTKFGNTQGVTSGTLVVTWTITAANPALIQVNANSSLTPSATYPRLVYSGNNFSSQAMTCGQ